MTEAQRRKLDLMCAAIIEAGTACGLNWTEASNEATIIRAAFKLRASVFVTPEPRP